ncbi:MAG: FkbM family methyltransferase [Peptococcaceae bacterium]|nr:FkbM family methyltransferase [Peptococcaceae bacterium]
MKGIYIGNNKALVCPVWGGKLLVPSDDLSVAPNLIMHGVHEPELTNYLLKTIRANYTTVDIGANLGYFTVLLGYLVGPGGKVIAYEADPGSFNLLRDNVSINYLYDRITLHNKAIYSSTCKLSFYITERFRGNASINEHDEKYFKHYNDNVRRIEVPAEPLDIYLGQLKHIDLVKLDIEGGEYHAFRGMADLIKNKVIDTVVFELNRGMLKDNWFPLYHLLSDITERYGAKLFSLTTEGNLVPATLSELYQYNGYPHVVMKL